MKKIYKKLIAQKTSFNSLLKALILKKCGEDYLQKLDVECKKELRGLQQRFPSARNNKHSLICCTVEKNIHKAYCESLRKVTDGKIRALLLSQKYQTSLILKETEKIEKYLI